MKNLTRSSGTDKEIEKYLNDLRSLKRKINELKEIDFRIENVFYELEGIKGINYDNKIRSSNNLNKEIKRINLYNLYYDLLKKEAQQVEDIKAIIKVFNNINDEIIEKKSGEALSLKSIIYNIYVLNNYKIVDDLEIKKGVLFALIYEKVNEAIKR